MDFTEAHELNSAIRSLTLRHRARASVLLADFGLHPGQEFLLLELAANGPRIQAALAEAIDCEPPSITSMVRKLEAAGYVERRPSEHDRRSSVVALTPAGEALLARLEPVWTELAENTIAAIDMPLADIVGIISRLADNSRRKGGPSMGGRTSRGHD